MNRGIIYVACGFNCRHETAASVAALRRVMPDVPVTVYIDEDDERLAPQGVSVVRIPPLAPDESPYARKVEFMAKSPYERTLFLDGDVLVGEDVSELFDILDRFDMAAALEWALISKVVDDGAGRPLSEAVPEFNSGVVAYRRNPRTDRFFALWTRFFGELLQQGILVDQPSFRQAFWASEVRVSPLPAIWNFRIVPPASAQVAKGRVRILHGRHADLDGLLAAINATDERRLVSSRLELPAIVVQKHGFEHQTIAPKPPAAPPAPQPAPAGGVAAAVRRLFTSP